MTLLSTNHDLNIFLPHETKVWWNIKQYSEYGWSFLNSVFKKFMECEYFKYHLGSILLYSIQNRNVRKMFPIAQIH